MRIKHHILQGTISAMALVSLLACGTEIGNPKKPTGGSGDPKPTSLVDDQAVINDMVAAQADEVIAAAADEAYTAIAIGVANAGLNATRFCSQKESGEAILDLRATGSLSKTTLKHGHEAKVDGTIEQAVSTIWKRAGGPVACTEAKDATVIDWFTAEGVSSDTILSIQKNMTITRQSPKGEQTRQSQVQMSGERHATWARDAAGDTADTFKVLKTTVGHLDKTFSSTRHGEPVRISSHIEIKADAPVVVAVEHDKATQAWRSKTLVSGAVSSTQGEDSRLEAAYANLRFTVDSGCVPESGVITGSVFRHDETSPLRSFSIEFTQGSATVTFDDGKQYPYVPGFCEFDDAK